MKKQVIAALANLYIETGYINSTVPFGTNYETFRYARVEEDYLILECSTSDLMIIYEFESEDCYCISNISQVFVKNDEIFMESEEFARIDLFDGTEFFGRTFYWNKFSQEFFID
jgi:hypothetical protein